MNCLIVEDELLAQEVIEFYIQKVDFLRLSGKCNNALQAFAALNKEPIDLMFLDIKMPEVSGIELIRSLKHPPKVILTTAFHEYALEGYELDVIDYLLKPISFERFLKAVNKAKSLTEGIHVTPQQMPAGSRDFFVRSDRKLIRINPEEIIYIEGLKNYLSIHLPGQQVIVHSTLTYLEEELSAYAHIQRVHKSFLVNKHFIRELDNNLIRLRDNTEIPIGGLYKDNLMQAMRII